MFLPQTKTWVELFSSFVKNIFEIKTSRKGLLLSANWVFMYVYIHFQTLDVLIWILVILCRCWKKRKNYSAAVLPKLNHYEVNCITCDAVWLGWIIWVRNKNNYFVQHAEIMMSPCPPERNWYQSSLYYWTDLAQENIEPRAFPEHSLYQMGTWKPIVTSFTGKQQQVNKQ